MGSDPILSPADASLTVERIWIPESLTWRDMKPGLASDAIRADLIAAVCGREVRFPSVDYGFGFEAMSTCSLKALLQALVSLSEGLEAGWHASHGGMRTHHLHLSSDPADRFELFIFDDNRLYLSFHTNRGGMLSMDMVVSLGSLLAAEEAATERIVRALDERGELDSAERHRYLGCWEHLTMGIRKLEGKLLSLTRPSEAPLG
ncbi:MAG TPA: hypothetical protein V6D05_17685 [Stenomitos sp.]